MFKKTILISALLIAIVRIFPQTVHHPNYGLKSHETLNIESMVLTSGSTTLFMVVENRSLDGTFCADRNIFIILSNGKRLKVNKTEGIPHCPDSYKFRSFGEKLYFSLTFPALPEGTLWFDLLEECDDACFSFDGVIIDAVLNQKIDNAYALTESGEYEEASRVFESLLTDFQGQNSSYEGAVYWNLIQLAKKMGDLLKANELYEKLNISEIPQKEKYIENLKNN